MLREPTAAYKNLKYNSGLCISKFLVRHISNHFLNIWSWIFSLKLSTELLEQVSIFFFFFFFLIDMYTYTVLLRFSVDSILAFDSQESVLFLESSLIMNTWYKVLKQYHFWMKWVGVERFCRNSCLGCCSMLADCSLWLYNEDCTTWISYLLLFCEIADPRIKDIHFHLINKT